MVGTAGMIITFTTKCASQTAGRMPPPDLGTPDIRCLRELLNGRLDFADHPAHGALFEGTVLPTNVAIRSSGSRRKAYPCGSSRGGTETQLFDGPAAGDARVTT
jgi:hypothetical protein